MSKIYPTADKIILLASCNVVAPIAPTLVQTAFTILYQNPKYVTPANFIKHKGNIRILFSVPNVNLAGTEKFYFSMNYPYGIGIISPLFFRVPTSEERTNAFLYINEVVPIVFDTQIMFNNPDGVQFNSADGTDSSLIIAVE